MRLVLGCPNDGPREIFRDGLSCAAASVRARLLNVLIHSQVFVEVVGPRQRCTGFLVASDHTVAKGIYEFQLTESINLMRLAAEDFPPITILKAAEGGSWSVWTGHQHPMADELWGLAPGDPKVG